MLTNCGFCSGVILTNEDRWTVDGVSLHLTLRPGATGDDKKDTCYWAYKHQKKVERFPWPNTVFQLRWLVIVFCLFSFGILADEPGDVRGGYFTYNWQNGRFQYWEPFIKIAHPKTSNSEWDEPEIWGFRPWNLEPPGEDGKTVPVNILESRFIPCDGKSHPVTLIHPIDRDRKIERSIRCPGNLW